MIGHTTKLLPAFATMALSLAAIGAGSSEPGDIPANHRSHSCDLEALGRAVAVDTANLRKSKVKFPWEESTEGASMTAYKDASVLKVLVVSFFGERGRVVSAYYLAPNGDFALVQEEVRYAQPIDAQMPPKIISRLPAVAYYCGDRPQSAMPDSDIVSAKGTLDSALAVLRRSGQ